MNIFQSLFKKKEKPIKIISFDGGGVRAIAGIVFLKKLEASMGIKTAEIFDMFVGTSAGSFNAACLAFHNMSADKLKKYWSQSYLKRMMQTSFFWDQASLIQARPRYEAQGRIDMLKEIFGTGTLGESFKPVLTICYDIEKRCHEIHSSQLTPEISFVDAISASSAAPMYFPTYQMTNGSWKIDGSVVTNNPTLIGYMHAKQHFNTDNIKILSIGTGVNTKKINGEASAKWGGVGWLRNDIMAMMLDSEIHNDIANDFFHSNYMRVNSPLGDINKMLDDNSEENLEKIHLMGLDWWSEFGDEVINFIKD